ncbi:MAG: alpha/beta fold hydrolase [Gemmatimonadetes bacterium]|nr:alpha/beta fold hydrolase [Gemmatimonadota bacterium]
MRHLFWIITAIVANTVAAATTIPPQERSIEGRWTGSISVAGQVLPMAVHFTTEDAGVTAAIDIQGATGVPLQSVSYDDPAVHFELQGGAGMAVFDGQHVADSIGGAFMQAGMAGTFAMTRAAEPEEPAATDDDPPPYRQEEVLFKNGDVTLAGTLTLPATGGPHPAAVMITGSGAQNRDEELFGFKPFLVIADHLTRNGIAVLRYDDRGVGGSSGSVSESTTEDFAGDVIAAVHLLQARPDINGEQVGLIGHSEGGVVAPLAASRSPDIAFAVLLAGTAVTGEEIIYEQGELILRANGATDAQIARQRESQERLFRAIKTDTGWDDLEVALRADVRAGLDSMPPEQRSAIADPDAYVAAQVQAQLGSARTPWFQYFLTYDPAVALRRIDVPVLALFGELDLQVPPAQNRPPMEEALRAGGNADYTIEVLPGANHLFITATTGSPTEYATLPKEFVPELLPTITEWLLARTSR